MGVKNNCRTRVSVSCGVVCWLSVCLSQTEKCGSFLCVGSFCHRCSVVDAPVRSRAGCRFDTLWKNTRLTPLSINFNKFGFLIWVTLNLWIPPGCICGTGFFFFKKNNLLRCKCNALPLLSANRKSCNWIFAKPRRFPQMCCLNLFLSPLFVHKKKGIWQTRCRSITPRRQTFQLWRGENFTAERPPLSALGRASPPGKRWR